MTKDKFYLFRRKRYDKEGGYDYIQHLTSASHDNGLSCSNWPEYSWRGISELDVRKMEYLISIDENYKNDTWELVRYEMSVEIPSWSSLPILRVTYLNLLENGEKIRELTIEEKEELRKYKQRYGAK